MTHGIAERFAELLNRHKDLNGWTVMGMAVAVWGDENRRGHMTRYLKAKGGAVKQETARGIADKLGISRAEVDAIYRARDWPVTRPPGLAPERNVVGREDDIAALHKRLSAQRAVAIVPAKGAERGAVLRGAGGIGKSTLARHYAATHAHHYKGVWWIGAQDPDALIADLDRLSGHLGVSPRDHATPQARAEAAVMALSADADPWLLVYDNAETPGALKGRVPRGHAVLVTSREGRWPGYGVQATGQLPEDAAADLLMQEAERDDDREGALSLARALDGLPLALVLAGGWLRDTSESFADYEARIEAAIDTRPEEVGVEDYPDSVFGAVRLSLDKLSEEAALLLRVLCWLSPDDLWPGLVTALADDEKRKGFDFSAIFAPIPDALWTLARDRARTERAFAELERRSLLTRLEEGGAPSAVSSSGLTRGPRAAARDPRVEREGDAREGEAAPGHDAAADPLETGYRLHRLTATVQRAMLLREGAGRGSDARKGEYAPLPPSTGGGWEGDAAASHRAVAAALLAASYPGSDRNPQYRENWPACARRQPHVAALAAAPPETAAMDFLFGAASVWLDAQRRDSEALAFSEDSLRLTEARLGKAHEEVGIACSNLAVSYWRAGRLEQAEALAARAVAIDETGASEANRAVGLGVHGIMAEMVGRSLTGAAQSEKLALAARRYRHALALNLRLQGRASREVPRDLNNLADLRAFQGRWDMALRLHAYALRLRRRALPPGDPNIANSLVNLAATLLRSGRALTGWRGLAPLDLLTEALAIREDAFVDNPAHPDRVAAATWLARAHWALAELGARGADPARAEALCAAYGLDPERQQTLAADYVARARARAFDADGTEPPGAIDR